MPEEVYAQTAKSLQLQMPNRLTWDGQWCLMTPEEAILRYGRKEVDQNRVSFYDFMQPPPVSIDRIFPQNLRLKLANARRSKAARKHFEKTKLHDATVQKLFYRRQRTIHSVALHEPFLTDLFNIVCNQYVLVFASVGGILKLFDIETKFLIERAIVAYRGRILSIEMSPCGNYLLTNGIDAIPNSTASEIVKVWRLMPNRVELLCAVTNNHVVSCRWLSLDDP